MLLKFKAKVIGVHVHVAVFAGMNSECLAKNGDLCFRQEEWSALKTVLFMGGQGKLSFEGQTEVVDSSPIVNGELNPSFLDFRGTVKGETP